MTPREAIEVWSLGPAWLLLIACQEPGQQVRVPVCVDPGGAATTETPVATDCTAHADCADDAFCGAGSCLGVEVTLTVCIEEAWVGGNWELDSSRPDVRAAIHTLPQDYFQDGVSMVAPTIENDPHPEWHVCEPLELVGDAIEMTVDETWQGEDVLRQAWANGPSIQNGNSDDYLPLIEFYRYVDQGCIEVPNTVELTGNRSAEVYISVWYP